jgi:hypothetical protein
VERLFGIDLPVAAPEEEVSETFRVRDELRRDVGPIEHTGGVNSSGYDCWGWYSPPASLYARLQLADRAAVAGSQVSVVQIPSDGASPSVVAHRPPLPAVRAESGSQNGVNCTTTGEGYYVVMLGRPRVQGSASPEDCGQPVRAGRPYEAL